jgi:hypothetical protein
VDIPERARDGPRTLLIQVNTKGPPPRRPYAGSRPARPRFGRRPLRDADPITGTCDDASPKEDRGRPAVPRSLPVRNGGGKPPGHLIASAFAGEPTPPGRPVAGSQSVSARAACPAARRPPHAARRTPHAARRTPRPTMPRRDQAELGDTKIRDRTRRSPSPMPSGPALRDGTFDTFDAQLTRQPKRGRLR